MSNYFVRFGVAVGSGAAVIAVYELCIRQWAARWGATDEELRRDWPGDEFVPDTAPTVTHAITINAPASLVWPWIVQVGQDRAGYYSYSWLENLFGAEIHNISRIVPEFQTRCVGDEVWMAPKHKYGGQARMVVARLDPGRAMVLVPPRRTGNFTEDQPVDGTWAFIVEPIAAATTRLICRGRSRPKQELRARFWDHVFWEPAHFIMERKMIMAIKSLAEQAFSSTQPAPWVRTL